MGSGLLLILGILIFGLLTLASLVFSIIYLAYSKPGRFIWLGIFFGSVLGVIVCISLTVNKAVQKVKDIGNEIEGSIRSGLDSSAANESNYATEASSGQIKYLKEIEPEEAKRYEKSQFYSYLGYADYYRLPLRWPYSIHCSGVPGHGELFNEKEVTRFDENDNGEESCGIYDIDAFSFNKNYLLIRLDSLSKQAGDTRRFIIYDLEKKSKQRYSSMVEMAKAASLIGFDSLKFVTCKEYYDRYNDNL